MSGPEGLLEFPVWISVFIFQICRYVWVIKRNVSFEEISNSQLNTYCKKKFIESGKTRFIRGNFKVSIEYVL